MRLKANAERPLYYYPWLHTAILARRPSPDLNKLAWVSIVKRGQIVLDVGANRGHYTNFFAYKVGANGRVYAFEPVPESADALRLRCSRLRNVRVFQVALSDEIGRKKLFIPGDDLQQASLTRQESGSWRKCAQLIDINIKVVTLDSWVLREGVERIDFIKLDVEGAEYKVLSGGADTLKRYRPLIYMEVCRDWLKGFGIELGDLWGQLIGLGYTYVYQAVLNNGRFRLLPVELLEIDSGDVLVSCRPLQTFLPRLSAP